MPDDYDDLMRPWHERFAPEKPAGEAAPIDRAGERQDPGQKLVTASLVAIAHREATHLLREQVLGRIYAQNHVFFEHLIINVLLEMGYGGRQRDLARCLGRSHDGGIDGVIEQDALALDVIYVQAKRFRPGTTVPIAAVRDFAGSLEARHATKGVFVTTAQFSAAAYEFVRVVSRRVVLINGEQLADLMIRHNIGVKVKETFQFKEVEPAYFAASAQRIPASTQPRK